MDSLCKDSDQFVINRIWLRRTAVDIDRIMRFLGPNHVEFSSSIWNRSIAYPTSEYCTKLNTLRLSRIGGVNRVSVSLALVGKWTHLGETLRNLTLVYLWG